MFTAASGKGESMKRIQLVRRQTRKELESNAWTYLLKLIKALNGEYGRDMADNLVSAWAKQQGRSGKVMLTLSMSVDYPWGQCHLVKL